MASSTKKRREEREQNLVQSTVTAVLKALKEQGIVPEKADNQNNENQTSKKAAQNQTQKHSKKHEHPPVNEVGSNEAIDYADDNNTHTAQPNNHIDIEIDSDTLDKNNRQTVKNTQEDTVQTVHSNVTANSSSQGKQTEEGDIREVITALLTGGGNIQHPSPGIVPQTDLFACGAALGSLVPLKLKQAIWNNYFVEMSDILSKKENRDLKLEVSPPQGRLSLEAPATKSQNLNITQWITAFLTFIDVYVQKYPAEISGLLVYVNSIRDLERVYGGEVANFYDRNFRTHRQQQNLPWGWRFGPTYACCLYADICPVYIFVI